MTIRGGVRSTRGLRTTMTARGQGRNHFERLLINVTVQKTSKYYTTEFDLEEEF